MAASFGERLLTEVSEEGLDEVATYDHSKDSCAFANDL